MPTHSRTDVIGFAIESVLAQSVEDFELLVVGDGCAPGTAEIVSGFRDHRIRFFDLPKAPFFGYANRNVAMREARGKYIGFAADDDLLFPDHLEILLKGLQAGSALAYSQALWVSTDGISAPFMTNLTADDELATFMERRNSIPASCFLYRADSLPVRDAWPEDVESAADWILWRRIIRENPNQPVFYCRTPTVLHFSAKRMASRHARMPEFATALDVADQVTWWPSPLRVSVPDGKTEQDVYAGHMRADPEGWREKIRGATSDLIARLAWEDIQTVRPYLAQVEEKLSATYSELAESRDRANLTIRELGRAESQVLEAQNANRILDEMLAAANEKIELQARDIKAMRSTVAWRLSVLLKRVPSLLRRQ